MYSPRLDPITECVADNGFLDHATDDYYRHVVLDNSLTSDNYFYSTGRASGHSFLEEQNGRLPVETKIFLTPPNAIRLQWQSATLLRDAGVCRG